MSAAPKNPPRAEPQAGAPQAGAPQASPPPIPLRDDPNAPMIYCTELAGGGRQSDNYALTFAALLYDHSEGAAKAYRKTNLRLVIPRIAVPAMIKFLQQLQSADAAKEKNSTERKASRTIQ